ncbi:MAG: hypothetical protein LJE67_08685 [Salaquimonas sp.]|nr:hypothetical protein [Salaquimonas sp.]
MPDVDDYIFCLTRLSFTTDPARNGAMSMMFRKYQFGAILLSLVPVATALSASAQEDPKSIVADQIREQGYACSSPKSAKHDEQASKPDEEVWILECENATYRVRLIPDMGARVEKLD